MLRATATAKIKGLAFPPSGLPTFWPSRSLHDSKNVTACRIVGVLEGQKAGRPEGGKYIKQNFVLFFLFIFPFSF